MSRSICAAVLVMLLSLVACSEESESPIDPRPPVRDLTQAEMTLSESGNEFGFNLFDAICQEDQNSNVFISPLSVSTAFGMVLNGARGETREALVRTLELAGLTDEEINRNYETLAEFLMTIDPSVTFEIANSVWTRDGFDVKDEFFETLREYYDAEVQKLDFTDPGAPGVINSWVDEKTHGKITSILDRIPDYALMYIINAVYFNALWTEPFAPENTYDGLFRLADGSTVQCRMMSKHQVDVQYFENDALKAVKLPYGYEHYNLIAILPKQGSPTELAATLDDSMWDNLMNSFTEEEIVLGFPKLKFEYEKSLKQILASMGMEIAFTPYANFRGMSDTSGLAITDVKHKAFVRIDEEGTEAAAVTSVEMGITSSPYPIFIADRPFLFAIWESNSNAILFIGKVEEPVF